MSTEGFADDGTMLKELAQFDLAQEMTESEQKRLLQEVRFQDGPHHDG
jgi:hypothetical protein